MIQVLEGEDAIAKNRELMGATDPKKADKGTIRADFADSIDANAVHGSDAAGDRRGRGRVLLPRHERLQPLTTGEPSTHEARVTWSTCSTSISTGSAAFCEQLGEKRFRATQLFRWIHQRGAARLRAHDRPGEVAARQARRRAPRSRRCRSSASRPRPTAPIKWLFDVGAGNAVETVFIPEADRGTLCISSQAGCAVGCRFCSTGHQGFSRNLTTGEIVAQLWFAEHRAAPAARARARASARSPTS